MIIACPLCNNELEVSDDIVDGQHIRCPYCNGKFSYAVEPEISEEQEWDPAYESAQRPVTRIPLSSARRPVAYQEKQHLNNTVHTEAEVRVGFLAKIGGCFVAFLLREFYIWLQSMKIGMKIRSGRVEYGAALFEVLFWMACFMCTFVNNGYRNGFLVIYLMFVLASLVPPTSSQCDTRRVA